MFSVCPGCGAYRPDRVVEAAEAVAVCPECGHRQPFVRKPLWVVGGASGSGKSTVCLALAGRAPALVLDSDLLWSDVFNTPGDGYASFFETWLRLAVALNQSGGSVVIFGAGFAVPQNLETRVYRRYLERIHYLALVCRDDELRERLRARPAWRESADETIIARQLEYNRWLRAAGPGSAPDQTVVDTTGLSVAQAGHVVLDWLVARQGR